MKNTLLLTALLAAFSFCQAQIFLEHTYNTYYVEFKLLRLEHSGYKYCAPTPNNTMTLYNLDHSVFKQLTLPVLPGNASDVAVGYITETLFDTDSTNIEYMINYNNGGGIFGSVWHTGIYAETGNVVFSKDSAFPWSASNEYGTTAPIYNTDEGAKLLLATGDILSPGDVLIYSLPGLLPCDVCDGQRAIGTGLPSDGYNTQFKLYPNPANKYTIIEYDLPKDTDNASLVVYNTAGQEQRRFKVDKGSRQMVLPTSEFTAGTYYYSLEIPGLGTTGKKALVIH